MIEEVVRKTVRLHPAQMAFRRSKALFRGFVGGRGAGKTWCGAYDLIRRLRPGRTYLVASPTGVLMGDTTYPTFKQLAEDFGVWGGCRLSPYPTATIDLDGGVATVRFRTAEDPERLRGPNLSAAWLDEASLMDEAAFKITLGCLRERGQQGWLSCTFTPKGLGHWTTTRFGSDPLPPDTEAFRARTSENPFLPEGFEGRIAAQLDDAEALRELAGEFIDIEGMEWPVTYFRKELWFSDWPTDIVCTVVALDPTRGKGVKEGKEGDSACYAIVRMDRYGTLWADAVYAREDIPRLVCRGVTLTAQFANPTLVVETNIGHELLVDEFKREMARQRVLFALDGLENYQQKVVRIRRLGPYLKEGRIRFRSTPGGRKLAGELQQFPNGKHDDGPDALEMAIRRLELLYGGKR